MSETRVPAIPAVTSSNLTDVAKAIKQVLDVREGVVGDPLDANVTFRDLMSAGLADASASRGRGTTPVVPVGTGTNGYNPATDRTPPPKPEGFIATGAFAVVILQWNEPRYRNHAFTEIWRSPTNVLGNAVLIGTSATRFYTDSIGTSSSAYYWARHVSQANVSGPYNDTSGVLGVTATDPGLVLASLTGQITEGQLFQSLASRIDLIDGPATLSGSVAAKLAQEASARAQAIADEAASRTTAINLEAALRADAINDEAAARTAAIATSASSLQSQIDLLSAASAGDVSSLIAVVKSEQDSRIEADQTLATKSNFLLTLHSGNAAAIKSEETARSTADGAQASALNILYANSGDARAAVVSEASARVAGDTSSAAQLSGLIAKSGANSAGIAAERNVSASESSVLAGQSLALTAVSGSSTSAILNEQQVRSSADSAFSSQTFALASSVSASNSSLQVEQQTRASADSALSSQTTTIAAATGGFSAGLSIEQIARTSANLAVASQISQLSSISGGNFSALRLEQQTRLDRDVALSSQITGFTSELSGNTASLRIEQQTRSAENSALSSQITKAIASVGDATSALVIEQSARATADASISSLTSKFSAIFGGSASALSAEQQVRSTADSAAATQLLNLNSALGTNASALTSEIQTRVSREGALSSTVLGLSAATSGNSAAIRTESSARSSELGAVSSVLQTVQASANGNTAAIQQEITTRATQTGELFAKYGVKVDVAGHVSGFGLLSTSNTATPTSQFGVRADQFFVAPASNASATAPTSNLYNGYVWLDTSVTPNVTRYWLSGNWVLTPPRLPFVIQSTPTTINGVSVPAGVYIDTAFIRDGTITNAKIGAAAIDDAKIANLSAAKINAGTLSADRISAGSITADKIDTRNLTIKDSLGNVIFSSSGTSYTNVTGLGSLATQSSVSTAQVTGLGALATQNSIDYTSITGTKPPFDATKNTVFRQATAPTGAGVNDLWFKTDTFAVYYWSGSAWVLAGDRTSSNTAAAIAGQGAFATLNQINTGNVSTYIEAGAIGNAYIGNFISSTNFDGVIDSSGNITNFGSTGWAIGKAGNATFNSVKLRGEINGGSYTGYAWPASGNGFHLGPSGLLLGNFNGGGQYFQVEASGNIYTRQFQVINGNLSIGNGKFVANSNGTVYADLVDIRRRLVLESGTLDATNVIYGIESTFDGKFGSYSSPLPPGTVLSGQITESVATNIYDYDIFNTSQNQPYYVACAFTGTEFRNWSGTSGSIFQLALTGRASVSRTYSNTGSYPNDFRLYITLEYRITLVSGSFNSFRVPLISWILYKL